MEIEAYLFTRLMASLLWINNIINSVLALVISYEATILLL